MKVVMVETALPHALPDTAAEPEFHPSARERLGVAAFVVAAVLATASWIALLAWGVIKLVQHL